MRQIHADKKSLMLYVPYSDKEKAKSIPGYQWNNSKKCWTFPLNKITLQKIVAIFHGITVNDSVHNNIQNHAYDMEKMTEIKKQYLILNEQYRNWLNEPFFDHQLKTYNFFRNIEVCADTSQPGIGKTLVQIGLMKDRIVKGLTYKILIVAPLSLLEKVWKHDIEKFFIGNTGAKFPIYVMDDTAEKARAILKKQVGIFIINYEKVWRLENEILRLNPDMMILDESSKIKNPNTRQTKSILKIGMKVRYKSIMTGTVTSNSMMDIFPQYKFLNENILGSTLTSFRNLYFVPSYRKFGSIGFNEWQITDRGKAEIKALIEPITVSWKKDECLDLPELIVQDIEFRLNPEQQKMYNQMKDYMLTEISGNVYSAQVILTKLLKLSMITSGFIQDTGGENVTEISPNAKANQFMELVGLIPDDSQIIVWAVFHHDIVMLKKLLEKKYGPGCAVAYYGKINYAAKKESYDHFKAGSARFFIAHPKSAGMGLNLSNANYSIFYSANYSFEDYAQSKERYNRTGQTKKMTEYRLMAKGTVDKIIFRAIEMKKSLNEFITDIKDS